MTKFHTKVLSQKQTFIIHTIIPFIMFALLILLGVFLIKQNTKKVFSASTTRSYLLSSGTVQDKPGQTYFFDLTSVSTTSAEVDLLNVVTEYWGVPWDIFAAGQTPADNWEWTQKMRAIVADISTNGNGKKTVLNLVLTREQLANKATVGPNNTLVMQNNWSGSCYDFISNPGMKTAYTRYVDWMVRLFNPGYVNVAVEVNEYIEKCYQKTGLPRPVDDLWNAVVDVERSAYDTVKAIDTNIVTFPSFVISDLYGYGQDCTQPMTTAQCDAQHQTHYDTMYPKLANLKRDYFAVSAYPYISSIYDPATGNHNMEVSDIPADWFTRAGDRGGERTIISETGWNSTNIVIDYHNTPWQILSSTEADQKAYLDRVLSDAETMNIDIVTWWDNLDLLPTDVMTAYPCPSDPVWCTVVQQWRQAFPSSPWLGELMLKLWGTNGIRYYDGSPKTVSFTRWQEAYNLPYLPPVIPTPTPTPTATPTPVNKLVFVTNSTFNGNTGGLTGADSKCQSAADTIPSLVGKTWKAWLSDGATSAATRLAHSSAQYTLINGIVVADNWTDLTDGTLRSPINITEEGTSVSSRTWTNTSISGEISGTDSNSTCSNWTNSGLSRRGKRGTNSNTNYKWTADGTSRCNDGLRLYCFEQ